MAPPTFAFIMFFRFAMLIPVQTPRGKKSKIKLRWVQMFPCSSLPASCRQRGKRQKERRKEERLKGRGNGQTRKGTSFPFSLSCFLPLPPLPFPAYSLPSPPFFAPATRPMIVSKLKYIMNSSLFIQTDGIHAKDNIKSGGQSPGTHYFFLIDYNFQNYGRKTLSPAVCTVAFYHCHVFYYNYMQMCPSGLYFTDFERNLRAEPLLQLSFGAESKKHSRPRAKSQCILQFYHSLRSRRLEVVGERENGPLPQPSRVFLARPFFLLPTTSKRLLRRLILSWTVTRQNKVVVAGP